MASPINQHDLPRSLSDRHRHHNDTLTSTLTSQEQKCDAAADCIAKLNTIDPIHRLDHLHRLAQLIETWTTRTAIAARDQGSTWSAIARPLNINRQAAHARYAELDTAGTDPLF